MVCGDSSFTVFLFVCWFAVHVVGHAVHKIREVWHHTHAGCLQNETKFGTLIERTYVYIISTISEFWPKGPPEAPKFQSG